MRADGTVKVLDFGLAKAFDPTGIDAAADASQSPTLISPAATRVGVILGTAAYMSPEQARGKTVDKRADVWAFGCVLYEMLVGTRPFAGDDVSQTMARVIEREPDWERAGQGRTAVGRSASCDAVCRRRSTNGFAISAMRASSFSTPSLCRNVATLWSRAVAGSGLQPRCSSRRASALGVLGGSLAARFPARPCAECRPDGPRV